MGVFHPNRWQGGNENKWIGKLETYQILARVRDKTQLLCHLPRNTSWRDSHSFTSSVLFKKACYLIPNAPINPSLVRIFIVPKMRLLSPDDA